MTDINITSLTDVLTAILAIFMITTPFLIQSGIPVKLPQTETLENINDKDSVTIVVTKDNRILVNNAKMTEKELKRMLKNKLLNNPDMFAVIKADETAYHGWVVEVIDAVKSAGISRMAIATELKDKKN
ncbi:MAG: Biopolymer transport protein ExbD [Elusimicrobia bacterium ADurb.Bin231]|nr:MAG: Biopolymer transport protein ExbD [Elusimicrobia bacterium ADurb.Bin231]